MNFADRELSAAGLSTHPSLQAYKRRMSEALRTYLEVERGRATRLADDVGISRSYVSDLANGKKTGSVPLLRRIAQATGIPAADLMGDQPGMSEGEAEPYQPGPKANRLRDVVATLFPGMRHPSYFTATAEHLSFGILAGDLLVTEASFNPEKVDPARLVVASLSDDAGTGKTVIARVARPWLVDSAGRICGEIDASAAILGVIQVVLRSADPAAY